jgi:DegV family protein with EDD domain
MTVGVITDATGDLPVELLKKHRLPCVPHLIIWGDETLVEGIDIDGESFYRRLAQDSRHPKTSQPTAESFVEAINQVVADAGAHEVVAVLVSEKVSGAIAACNLARQMVDVPVHIVDTRTVSLGLGMAAIAAAEARDAGADVGGVIAATREVADKTHTLFTVDTLEYLHRGGRIGRASWMLGTALAIKPVLAVVDGAVEGVGRVRTRKRALMNLLDIAEARIVPGRSVRMGVMHGAAPNDAAWLADQARARFAPETLIVTQICAAIGVHAGPRVAGLAFYQP